MHLSHRDLGGAGLPPLVVLHGMLGSSRNWQTAGKDLSANYHVFALDMRNHGASPHADSMTYEEMMGDVIEWLDAQNLRRVSLMGQSMGGKVAMLLACRYPDRVEQLIVVDIAPKDYKSAAHRAEFAAMHELNLDHLQSRAEAELRFEARVSDWAMRKFLTTNLERTPEGPWKWIINLPVIAAALPILESNPLKPEDRYTGPTRFIIGGKSRYVKLPDHPAILQHFPAAKIETIEEAGHNPHMETREKFVSLLLA
jgi:pimeloyl-ACP methyl ester carboxylesterase